MAFEHRFHSGLTARIDGRGCEQRLVWIVGENSHEEAVALALCVVDYIWGRWPRELAASREAPLRLHRCICVHASILIV